MKTKKLLGFSICVWVIVTFLFNYHLMANEKSLGFSVDDMEKKIQELMEEGKIPGLALVIVKGNGQVFTRGYGYADLEKREPVTPGTLFELASCSKGFTALAALQLEKDGLLNLENHISDYFPWFSAIYKDQKCKITLRQLLHHTSGIPWESISYIPPGKEKNALEQTLKNIDKIKLNSIPGKRFEYASVNYDIVGAIIEETTGMAFEDYMIKHIFGPLELENTGVGQPQEELPLAIGHKISFFKPRKYIPPVYRGNNPAAYVISNATDISKWLKLQMGIQQSEFASLIKRTQIPDTTVPPTYFGLSSYAMGWWVKQYGSQAISHGGENPNFSSYMAVRNNSKVGVAVLANSNSDYTSEIGRYIMNLVTGEEDTGLMISSNNQLDKVLSVSSIGMIVLLLGLLAAITLIIIEFSLGKRQFKHLSVKTLGKFLLTLLLCIPIVVGIYLIPKAIARVSWNTALVWGPLSLPAAIYLLLIVLGTGFLAYILATLFPHKNKYKNELPKITLLSIFSGVANSAIIFLIINNVGTSNLLYYFALAVFIFLIATKIAQSRLKLLSNQLTYDLRMELVRKIFATTFGKFEKVDRGQVYAAINNDVSVIGSSLDVIVYVIYFIITLICGFAYMATINFFGTMMALGVVLILGIVYYIVSQRVNPYFEDVRKTRDVFMGLIDGLLHGYKELRIHRNKIVEYREDIHNISQEFKKKLSSAEIKFVNANVMGDTFIVLVMGAVSFGFAAIFPAMKLYTIASFIMVLLYLTIPVKGLLQFIPNIMQLRISLNHVQQFTKSIPADENIEYIMKIKEDKKIVKNIKAEAITFAYKTEDGSDSFSVGPIDFEVNSGEVLFIIGGNGSGKTTIAKLLTGLYIPEKGMFKINSAVKDHRDLGEYFSVIFSDFYLFEKLYNIDLKDREEEIQEYIKLLDLTEKVQINGNSFSTIDLSGGQRKRLALLRCYLEDRPIYLFDEWAADQDPQYRKFFYRNLLLKMKKEGKIVIAITHDDHYFDVADKIMKLDMGKIDLFENRLNPGSFKALK